MMNEKERERARTRMANLPKAGTLIYAQKEARQYLACSLKGLADNEAFGRDAFEYDQMIEFARGTDQLDGLLDGVRKIFAKNNQTSPV